MKTTKLLLITMIVLCLSSVAAFSTVRIAVLPFKNIDGHRDYDKWSFVLQEGLAEEIRKGDPEEYNYTLIPLDTIKAVLAKYELDPNNNEYESGMWQAVEELQVDKVVSGNFIYEDGRLLINAFIYEVKLRLPNPNFQARDLFVKPSDVQRVIPVIHKKLRQGILGN